MFATLKPLLCFSNGLTCQPEALRKKQPPQLTYRTDHGRHSISFQMDEKVANGRILERVKPPPTKGSSDHGSSASPIEFLQDQEMLRRFKKLVEMV